MKLAVVLPLGAAVLLHGGKNKTNTTKAKPPPPPPPACKQMNGAYEGANKIQANDTTIVLTGMNPADPVIAKGDISSSEECACMGIATYTDGTTFGFTYNPEACKISWTSTDGHTTVWSKDLWADCPDSPCRNGFLATGALGDLPETDPEEQAADGAAAVVPAALVDPGVLGVGKAFLDAGLPSVPKFIPNLAPAAEAQPMPVLTQGDGGPSWLPDSAAVPDVQLSAPNELTVGGPNPSLQSTPPEAPRPRAAAPPAAKQAPTEAPLYAVSDQGYEAPAAPGMEDAVVESGPASTPTIVQEDSQEKPTEMETVPMAPDASAAPAAQRPASEQQAPQQQAPQPQYITPMQDVISPSSPATVPAPTDAKALGTQGGKTVYSDGSWTQVGTPTWANFLQLGSDSRQTSQGRQQPMTACDMLAGAFEHGSMSVFVNAERVVVGTSSHDAKPTASGSVTSSDECSCSGTAQFAGDPSQWSFAFNAGKCQLTWRNQQGDGNSWSKDGGCTSAVSYCRMGTSMLGQAPAPAMPAGPAMALPPQAGGGEVANQGAQVQPPQAAGAGPSWLSSNDPQYSMDATGGLNFPDVTATPNVAPFPGDLAADPALTEAANAAAAPQADPAQAWFAQGGAAPGAEPPSPGGFGESAPNWLTSADDPALHGPAQPTIDWLAAAQGKTADGDEADGETDANINLHEGDSPRFRGRHHPYHGHHSTYHGHGHSYNHGHHSHDYHHHNHDYHHHHPHGANRCVTHQGPQPMNQCESKEKRCEASCGWTCDSPRCERECEPLCEAPVCRTFCKKSRNQDNCELTCGKPDCTTVCPKQCSGPNCNCRTVCGAPNCHTTCRNDCQTLCATPKCEIHCKTPRACPKPVCHMTCKQLGEECNVGGNTTITPPTGFAAVATDFAKLHPANDLLRTGWR